MAPRRCRSCNVLAPGGEVPVVRSADAWSDWHLCGHCWALLIVGLQLDQSDNGRPNLARALRELRLNPQSVRIAIRDGLQAVGGDRPGPRDRRDEIIDQDQRLLAELLSLSREIEASASYGVPREAWGVIRQRVIQIRAEVRVLRRKYAPAPSPKGAPEAGEVLH